MRNAKQELQEILKDKAKIKCAIIYNGDYWGGEDERPEFRLPLNYTDADLVNYYNSLDFEYDSGFGGQELFGTVWLEDGTWLSRGEYDGSEWWEHNVLPAIPTDLLGAVAG
jgi:hypothetical protein